MQVRTTSGYTNRQSLDVLFNLGTNVKGASMQGAFLRISNAVGWPADLSDPRLNVTLSSTLGLHPLDVVSCCSGGSAVFRVPPAATSGMVYTFNFTGAANSLTVTVQVSSSSTQTLTINTAMPIAAGAQSLSVTLTNVASNPISAI